MDELPLVPGGGVVAFGADPPLVAVPWGEDVGVLPLVLGAAAALLANLIPDYLSLLETRWVIRWAQRSG